MTKKYKKTNMTWMDKYKLAKNYFEHYGDLNIPYSFRTNNGVDYDEDGFPLGVWMQTQRLSNKGLGNGIITPKQIEKLNEINVIWDVIDYRWNKFYELAKKYYEHYGDLNITRDFKTTNGIDYDEDGFQLGNWLENQRQSYKGHGTGRITQSQIEKLDSIKIIWDLFDYNWNKMYELAKKYYEHYGNLNIPYDFKTINGVDYDEFGFTLGIWIQTQRQAYKGNNTGKLTPQKIEKLDGIEMIWDLLEYKWNKYYELAKKYYEHYGNLNIPQYFKTTTGISYDELGSPLGRWIETQRQYYKGKGTGKLIPQKIEKLDNIEMVWYTSNRKKEESQKEIIDDSNNIRKQIEVLNQFYTLLNQYNKSDLPDRDTLNQDFINQLDYKSLHLKKDSTLSKKH